MIDLNNILFHYPGSDYQLALQKLTINRGERIAFVGPSGIGKTTLLQIIAGILLPNQGAVRIDDHNICQWSDTMRRQYRISNMGFIFQDFKLLEYLTVKDNILLPFRINRKPAIDNKARRNADKLAGKFGITQKMNRYPGALSHGERQRVAIVRALINDPTFILADEPTGNLDPVNKKKIMETIFGESEQRNGTLLVVTHDHQLLDKFDRCIDLTTLIQQ